MIATLAEIKAFLGITSSDYDTLIQTYIPIVTEDIVEYCNNKFIALDKNCDEKIEYAKSTFAYVDSDPDTITDSDSGFVTAGFIAGDDILVEGSFRNDGYYTISSLSAGTLTLTETIDALTAEDLGLDNTIYLVQWPKGLAPIFSQMVGYMVQDVNERRGVKSEALGQYSVTYGGKTEKVGNTMYPTSIVSGLSAWNYLRIT